MQCMLMEHYGLAQNQVSMAYNLLPPQHILCVRCVCVWGGGGYSLCTVMIVDYLNVIILC